jgi:hypothetical protein
VGDLITLSIFGSKRETCPSLKQINVSTSTFHHLIDSNGTVDQTFKWCHFKIFSGHLGMTCDFLK